MVAEGFQAGFFEGVAVEQVVGVEGDEALAVGVGDVDAGFFDAAEVEGLGVDELDDEDAEEVVVAEVFGARTCGRQQRSSRRVLAWDCGEWLVEKSLKIWLRRLGFCSMVGADGGVLLVDDGVAAAVDEDVGGDEAGEGDDFAGQLQGVGHGEGVGVAGDGDDVFGFEDGGLGEDAAADFGEGEAVRGGVEVVEAAGLLDGLEGDAADAGLLEGEVDDGAELVVVDSAFDGDDEGGGDVELVEAFEGAFADVAEVGAAELHEGFAAEGVELEVELEAGHVGGEALGEGFVLRDADAVGVDHEVLDGAAFGGVEDFEELRVDGGLAAGDLDDVGLGFVGDDAVEHALDLVEGFVFGAVRAGSA